MPHDESGSEQLWTYIQARKQREAPNKDSRVTSATNGAGPSADAVLVEALYQTLQDTNATGASDGSQARAALQAVIAASPMRKPAPAPARRPFWQLSGPRQLIQAVALLLVTVAAIGYLVWSSWSASCQHSDVPDAVPPAKPAPAPAPTLKDRHAALRGIRGVASDQSLQVVMPISRKCE